MLLKDCIEKKDDLLPEDLERFRMATLRAKLASFGVYAERDADEEVLCRLLAIAEQREERRLAQQKKHAHNVKQTGYVYE